MKKSTLRKYIRQVIEEQMGMQRQTPRPTMTPNRAGGRQTPRPGGGREVKIAPNKRGIMMITNLMGNPRTNGEWLEAYKKWYVQNQDNVVSGNLGSPQEVEACFRDKGIKVLSYFITGSEDKETSTSFKNMYGPDATNVNVNNLNQLAKTLNNMFIEK